MKFFVLSHRSMYSNVVYDAIYNIENIFAKSCEGVILAPKIKAPARINQKLFHSFPICENLNERIIKKTLGKYQELDLFNDLMTQSGSDRKVLFILAIFGGQLDILSCIPQWRQKFDTVIAYICDSWAFETYSKNIYKVDHLFVALPELVTPLRQKFGIPVSLLPFAADVLGQGSRQQKRGIDVTSFGRMPMEYHQHLVKAFNHPGSSRLYYRFSARQEVMFPSLPYEERLDREAINTFYHILRNTKILLAFDTIVPNQPRKFPESFITFRWFDGIATGCILVGKRPITPLMNELFDWEDSSIEIPDSPQQSPEFIEELLRQEQRMQRISQANYFQSVCKHDWRFRIQAMLEEAQLPPAATLLEELQHLRELRVNLEQENWY